MIAFIASIVIFVVALVATFSPYIHDGILMKKGFIVLGISSYASAFNPVQTNAGFNARIAFCCAILFIAVCIVMKARKGERILGNPHESK